MDLSKAHWRKSSHSGSNGGACVEIASNFPGRIAIRDSKNPSGSVLIVSHSDWKEFLRAIKDGSTV
ncbi:DUF397 domain-containing protein [Thermopolyspora sp. NPDC052614]|uniref:DUF397 domain-containing protein n=1 Tax=Thermopolyspora sp. NPDC052614 TaxID=3155682 RepID=UPI00342EB112